MFISSRIAPLLELFFFFFKVEPKSYCVALTLLCFLSYYAPTPTGKPTNIEQILIFPFLCENFKALKQTRIFMHFLIPFHLQM